MPISAAKFVAHAQGWAQKLGASRSPFRRVWPHHLFRHERLENAIPILRSGMLRSRSDATGFIDIAAGDVLAQDERARSSVRLYFRPRTPTQYRIEGIRRQDEIWHNAHCPVIVMFVFRGEEVLTASGTRFSDGNMQSEESSVGDSDEFFDRIDFADVYHCEAFSQEHRDRIVRARCAEVLAASPLQLRGNLRAVLCRSPAERTYLLDALGDVSPLHANDVVVHAEPGIFESRWAYVDTVDASSNGFTIKFHPRVDGARCSISVQLSRDGRVVAEATAENADLSKTWIMTRRLAAGEVRCEIQIDGCLGYSAAHLIDDMPF